jgi:hypothetical protein
MRLAQTPKAVKRAAVKRAALKRGQPRPDRQGSLPGEIAGQSQSQAAVQLPAIHDLPVRKQTGHGDEGEPQGIMLKSRMTQYKQARQKAVAKNQPKPPCFQSVGTWSQASLACKLHLLALAEPDLWNPATSFSIRTMEEVAASLAIGFDIWPETSFPSRQVMKPHHDRLLNLYRDRGKPLGQRLPADIVQEWKQAAKSREVSSQANPQVSQVGQ